MMYAARWNIARGSADGGVGLDVCKDVTAGVSFPEVRSGTDGGGERGSWSEFIAAMHNKDID